MKRPILAHQILAIDLEGTEVCDWLTFRGMMLPPQ